MKRKRPNSKKVVSMTFEEPGLEERHREGRKTKFLASLYDWHWLECLTYDASLTPTVTQW